MDPSIVSAGAALAGVSLAGFGNLANSYLQQRLGDRTRLREERQSLYAEAMLHAHFIVDGLSPLVDGWYTEDSPKRQQLRNVPDAITTRVRLIAPGRIRDAWLAILDAEKNLYYVIDEEFPGVKYSNETMLYDQPELVTIRQAAERFEQECRKALGVKD
jgi:hypothetical protein